MTCKFTYQAKQQLLGHDEGRLEQEEEQRAPLPAGAVAHVAAGSVGGVWEV